MTPELFISLIKNGMEKSGISLREVARFVEVDPSFLSKILAGKRSPPSDEKILKKLAEVLNLDPLRLIVSTGTIPSEWQSAFESQGFLDELKKISSENSKRLVQVRHSGESRNPEKKLTGLDSRFRGNDDRRAIVGVHKSKELSEDLL